MTKKKTSKTTIHAPRCYDSAMGVKEGNTKVQGKNIKSAVDVINECGKKDLRMREHLTVSVRAKDEEGKWYFSVACIPFANLQSGGEIIIDAGKKLVIK